MGKLLTPVCIILSKIFKDERAPKLGFYYSFFQNKDMHAHAYDTLNKLYSKFGWNAVTYNIWSYKSSNGSNY